MAGEIGEVKIKAKLQDGVTSVRAQIIHPMETGARKDEAGNLIPAHFIQEVTCTLNGQNVLTGQWGPAVSAKPFISFRIKGGKVGDTLRLSWVDNKGESNAGEAQIE